MSEGEKRGLKQNFGRGLKRIKLFPSSSGDPGPSTQSTQQVNTLPMPGSNPQPISEYSQSSFLSPAAPPRNAEPHENAPNPRPGAERSAKRERWTELKTLANILSKGFNNFGPLKQALEGIAGSIEIFETAAQNRTDYENLRNDLNALFHDLAGFFDASTPPIMAPTVINFAQGIDRELEMVRLRLSETSIGTHVTDADEVLEHYRRIQALLQRLTSDVGFKTLRIVDEQATDSRLKSLPHSPAAKYSSAESSDLRVGCTRDTRVDLLEDIYEWACNDRGQKIYWLNGMAGTGKTTIAYSFCERLDHSKKLAASFFCSRQLPSCRDVNRIVPTMSYQLSGFSRPFRSALSEVLQKKQDAHNQVLLDQLKDLLIEPLELVRDTLPADLVIVIDALDECDNNDGVDRMLSALLSHAQQLPVKFFVASRPDAKILDRMRGQHGESVPTELRLHELDRPTVQEDIKTYLNAQLEFHMHLSATNLDTLVERSGVLFVYASTVVRYLECDNFSRAEDRLEEILKVSKGSANDSEKDINDLYTVILAAALNSPKMTSRDKTEMKLVLSTVICAQEPQSIDAMAGLLGLSTRKVQAALRPLFSVLHLSDMTAHKITTLHESFPDYLLDKNRSGEFHCDAKKHHTHLAQQCFQQMKLVNPPFNICNLESSYVPDMDVPDLPARVEKAISKQLLYACRHWVAHCMSAEVSQHLLNMLREFASEQFLLWMEIMNLSRKIDEGVKTLDRVRVWSSDAIQLDEDIRGFLRDMSNFATEFSTSRARTITPHIYVSALTFWPSHSPISDHYRQQQSSLITARSTAMSPRKSNPVATRNVGGNILCVACSQDGAYIVSGSGDNTILIWDTYTGRPIGQPLRGHTSDITSVAYSPDDAYIVSGSRDSTVRIWDTHTGQPVGQPLEGYTGIVNSVAYSPDGAYIVSGSRDCTIHIWDAHTGRPVGQPLRGHTGDVNSVAYSPDGAYIVSGSCDSTIRIWDAHTRQPVEQALEGHTSSVTSVVYSPDGAYILSGSRDRTIRIWDAHTGQPVGQPLQGDIWSVNPIAYSPDGAYIVSGSRDYTIRIWDAHTRQPVGYPLKGHTNFINSVAYSPDGAYIISSASDNAIRVWDIRLALLMGDASEVDNSQPQLARSLHTISEPRILCNLGCRINCPHMAWTFNRKGWMLFNSNRLLWVPFELRALLLFPANTALMSPRGFLHLDLDRNKLGEHWHEFFRPRKSINL